MVKQLQTLDEFKDAVKGLSNFVLAAKTFNNIKAAYEKYGTLNFAQLIQDELLELKKNKD